MQSFVSPLHIVLISFLNSPRLLSFALLSLSGSLGRSSLSCGAAADLALVVSRWGVPRQDALTVAE